MLGRPKPLMEQKNFKIGYKSDIGDFSDFHQIFIQLVTSIAPKSIFLAKTGQFWNIFLIFRYIRTILAKKTEKNFFEPARKMYGIVAVVEPLEKSSVRANSSVR